jgi:amidase
LRLFGQDLFEKANATKGTSTPQYLQALKTCTQSTRSAGIDRLLAAGRLDALIAPSYAPAWRSDVVDGDNPAGGGAIASLAAVAGYPHLTVPMGYVKGLPVGISFVAGAWSEAKLLALGAAYERAAHARRAPGFVASIERTPGMLPLLEP